ELVAPVVADGRHHLGEDALAEELAMEGDVVEADERELLAELRAVAAEAGLEDEAADLGRSALVEDELGGDVRGAGLEVLAEELAPAEAHGEVRVAGASHARDDLARAEGVAGVGV